MDDVSIELQHEVAGGPDVDVAHRVPPRHPELAGPSDDAPLGARDVGDEPAQDRQRAPVVLPRLEHEVDDHQQISALLGGLRRQPLRLPDELRARLGAIPQRVVQHDDRPEGVEGGVRAGRDCDEDCGRVRAGESPVEEEVQVGHLLSGCGVFMAGCGGNCGREGEGKEEEEKKKHEGGVGVGHGEALRCRQPRSGWRIYKHVKELFDGCITGLHNSERRIWWMVKNMFLILTLTVASILLIN
ncbi:hypothetical protein MUK42_32820 [Musa troglodytarum]|uniref:Uncharacterized protein n=1 Tax=Musa troglodytarum TaxID=320322 RepID=A0A9E7H5G8_9LILI|nr:hypothetical protein MUK42_32820 [Musa troglodytarum]